MSLSIGNILKNISGGGLNPISGASDSVKNAATSVQDTVSKEGAKIEDSAKTIATVSEVYSGVQIAISLGSLAVAYGMLEMYRKMYALQVRRGKSKGKRR